MGQESRNATRELRFAPLLEQHQQNAPKALSVGLHIAAVVVLFTLPPFASLPQKRLTPGYARPTFVLLPKPFSPKTTPKRHQSPAAIPTPVQKISIGVFDDVAKPDTSAPLHLAPGRIATGGFTDASDPTSGSSGTKGKIITGVLGGDTSGHGSGASVAGGGGASGGADEPPRMLSAPHAAYTEVARRLSIKGSVVLRVLLTSSGKVQVLATIKTLGYGLDESAREAAQAMEFEPARKHGKPVDYITTVSVIFDLT